MDERRDGFKKVDDEHLISLAKTTASFTKQDKERKEKLQRTDFILQSIRKLAEDSIQTKA